MPADELAEAAGIEVSDGVLVDERLESSAPGVFAAGDVANAMPHPFGGRRVAGRALGQRDRAGQARGAGDARPEPGEEPLPYFFSDQYDVGMEYTGDADRVRTRSSSAATATSRELIAFWLREGRVLAGMNVNVWDVTDDIGALIRSRAQVDRERLADPEVPLVRARRRAGLAEPSDRRWRPPSRSPPSCERPLRDSGARARQYPRPAVTMAANRTHRRRRS